MANDFYAMFARERFALPVGWEPFRYEVINDRQIMLKGAVPIGVRQKGKRKGAPIWPADKDCASYVIDKGELDQFIAKWERETGKCKSCDGTGQAWAGWSVAKGNEYRPCDRCKATGVAP